MPSGKNKLLMAPFRHALEKAGLQDVRTYIQSGNALVSTLLEQTELEERVHQVIKNRFGGDIQVLVRSPSYFRQVMENNPFMDEDPSKLYYTLLKARPEKKLLQAFHALDHGPDQVRVRDDIAYIRCSTLYRELKANNNFIEKKLKVVGTTRNFNTMSKLLALSQIQATV